MGNDLGIVFVIGPSGTGKSTIASLISEKSGGAFLEGDDFHPASNVKKMRAGIPLTDEDRRPWLRHLAGTAARDAAKSVIVSCSALKLAYRDALRQNCPGARFIFLDLAKTDAIQRVGARENHYMPSTLVESQFADLDRPSRSEADVSIVSANQPIDAVFTQAWVALSNQRQ